MTDGIITIRERDGEGAVSLTDAMTGKGLRLATFGGKFSRTRGSAYADVMGYAKTKGINIVETAPQYIRADVAEAQLAERDARIAELEEAANKLERIRAMCNRTRTEDEG